MANSTEGPDMSGFQYDGHGALKYVTNLQRPTPGRDEVLVRVEAVSLNPADWKNQKAMQSWFHPRRIPFIPVTDIAGEVSCVGSGVTKFKKDDKVISMLPLATSGGLAEYVIAPVNMTVIRPPEVSAAEGSGLCTAALAAHQALDSFGVNSEGTDDEPRNILITAASGGVGHYAVQLAKLGNFHITATCGASNMDLVRGLGADEVVDYKTPDGESLRSPSGRKYDCVINCAEDISWFKKIKPNLAASAVAVYTVPRKRNDAISAQNKFNKSGKLLKTLKLEAKLRNLEILVGLAKEGKIRTVVHSNSPFPFINAKIAWAKGMSGHATGKIIIEMPVVK